jgi:hypothetical protein
VAARTNGASGIRELACTFVTRNTLEAARHSAWVATKCRQSGRRSASRSDRVQASIAYGGDHAVPYAPETSEEMSRANPRWGAPRIDDELLKLGVDLRQAIVGIPRRSKALSSTWHSFLRNHMTQIAAGGIA